MPERPHKPRKERKPRQPREQPRRPVRPAQEHDNAHDLIPDWLRAQMPNLYSTEKVADPMVQAKFFTPDSNWTWYATEYDGEDVFFGLVDGFEAELGYFSLSELQEIRGPLGLQIERDVYFDPTPLSQIQPRDGS